MDNRFQASLFDDNAEYDAFTEKFKPKKTTDDCYTPAPVYEAVAAWVAQEYGVDPAGFVRPFFPEMDFIRFEYPDACTVVDNPPFSLLASIIRFYSRNGIRFFLFAPALTLFTATECQVCYLGTGVDVTYENGAEVPTSFVTNLDRMRLRTVPELRAAVKAANAAAIRDRGAAAKELPKYVYPDCVISAAAMQKLSKYGAELNIAPDDSFYIGALDAQRAQKKSIFGGGFLLREGAAAERAAAERAAAERAAAERAAAERAAAERAAAHVWELSEREKALVYTHTHTHTSGRLDF